MRKVLFLLEQEIAAGSLPKLANMQGVVVENVLGSLGITRVLVNWRHA